jgi:hypothetical protein
LERWSDAAAFAEMMDYADALKRYTGTPEGVRRHAEANRRRETVEAAFLERVRSGEILASAIAEPGDAREIVSLAAWELLEIDYEFDILLSESRRYEKPEFFEPSAIPLNITHVPDWVSGLPSFQLPAPLAATLAASMPVLFAVDGHSVSFNAGADLDDDAAELILTLLPKYKEGIAANRPPERFGCMRASAIADALGVNEQNVRQRIVRTRQPINDAFRETFGVVLDINAVVENVLGKGYRLNPRIILVQPFQLTNRV